MTAAPGWGVHIFEGELIVGAIGEYRKCGILTPEFSWQWVDREMDHFATRPQDPYIMTDDQRRFVREKIFPYWKGKSLEEAFLARLPAETRHIGVDTGVIDSDSKWRQAVGEVTPDYQDVLFKKGFGGIIWEVQQHLAALDITNPEDEEKRDFYESVLLTSRGIILYANRYADEAERLSALETDPARAAELLQIAANCRHVPENPPRTFYEAMQFLWFVQVGGILSENPLSLNPGRFDQYMDPYPISNEQLTARKTQMYAPQLTIFCQIQRKLCNLRPKSPIHNDFEGTTKIDLRFLSSLL